jgi:hypothetical protein
MRPYLGSAQWFLKLLPRLTETSLLQVLRRLYLVTWLGLQSRGEVGENWNWSTCNKLQLR